MFISQFMRTGILAGVFSMLVVTNAMGNAMETKIPVNSKKVFSCEFRHLDFIQKAELNQNVKTTQEQADALDRSALVLRHTPLVIYYSSEKFNGSYGRYYAQFFLPTKNGIKTCEVPLSASYMSDAEIQQEMQDTKDIVTMLENKFSRSSSVNGFQAEGLALAKRTLVQLNDTWVKKQFVQNMYWSAGGGEFGGCGLSLSVHSIYEGVVAATGAIGYPVFGICEDMTSALF